MGAKQKTIDNQRCVMVGVCSIKHRTFRFILYKMKGCALMQPNEIPVHSGKDSQFTPMKTTQSAEKRKKKVEEDRKGKRWKEKPLERHRTEEKNPRYSVLYPRI